MHCMYILQHTKSTSQAEVTSNSKPVALAVIELRYSEGISQLLCQSVEISINKFFFETSIATF